MLLKQKIIFLVLTWLVQSVSAQMPSLPGYIVQTYGAANGLPSSEILSIYQDREDFIWIGSKDGISRFDGKVFKNYESVNSKRIGSVFKVSEDKNARLWIAAESGLYYWDNNGFRELDLENKNAWLPFYTIHFTNEGDTIAGSLKGPLTISGRNKNKEGIIPILFKDWQKVTQGEPVHHIRSYANGIFFATDLNVYHLSNETYQRINNEAKDYINGMQVSEKGQVYWTNLYKGLYHWNGRSILQPMKDPAFYFDLVKDANSLYSFNSHGIIHTDTQTDSSYLAIDMSGLGIRTPTRFLIDKEKNFWLGSTEGIFRIRKNPFRIHWQKLAFSDEIYSLLRRKNGDLLLGSNRGRIFEVRDSLKYYKDLQVVPLAEVFHMYEDERNWLWFATGYQGISVYRDGRLINFNKSNGLGDNSHHWFYKARDGVLWSAGDNGITRINYKAQNDSFQIRYFEYPVSVAYHKLVSMIESPVNTIWTAGQLGLFYLQNDSLVAYQMPGIDQPVHISQMKMDAKGMVWIATRGWGILVCSFNASNKLEINKQFLVRDGLSSRTYLSVDFDDKGNVWAGNYSGVTAIYPNQANGWNIRNFDVADGFIARNFQSLRMYNDGSGTMWACTSSGAVSFDPGELLSLSRNASLRITSIDLLDSKLGAGGFINGDQSYSFPYYINSISLNFAALHYSNPGAVRYYYRLSNMDSIWTDVGKEGRIQFRELPPGNYNVLIKASVGGNQWTNTISMSFSIASPWWRQWWFISGMALLAGAFIYLFIRKRERNFKKKEQEKTEMEKLRSTSYRHQLEIEQVINYFTASLSGHNTVEGVLWDVARNCISRLGFEDCVIYLVEEDKNMLVQKAAWGPKTAEENSIINPIEIAIGQGIVGTVALTGKAEKIDDTSFDDRYIVDDVRRYSEITVPIFEEGKVIGVIDSEHSRKNFYTERHMHILATIASHCGARIGRIRAAAREQEARMEALMNRQKALEASLQSMRLQMNPHFLFNALNSIQQMILAGEEITATRFLSKFSKLLRLVLTSSDKEELCLKDELEILNLYVELEALRFKETFTYKISCSDKVDQEETYVPSLLFQPFVENAIWHGLMHKDGDKKLEIRFDEQEEGLLVCIIEDNGVGRNIASLNNLKQDAVKHTGKGITIGWERLAAMNEKHGTQNSLQVIDLKDQSGRPAGTRVQISLYHNN